MFCLVLSWFRLYSNIRFKCSYFKWPVAHSRIHFRKQLYTYATEQHEIGFFVLFPRSPVSIRTVYFGMTSWILISFIFAYRLLLLHFFLLKLCSISKLCHSIVFPKVISSFTIFFYWKWLLSSKSVLSRIRLKSTRRTIIRNLDTNKPIWSDLSNLKIQSVGVGPF